MEQEMGSRLLGPFPEWCWPIDFNKNDRHTTALDMVTRFLDPEGSRECEFYYGKLVVWPPVPF